MLRGNSNVSYKMISKYYPWLPVLVAVAAAIFTFASYIPQIAAVPLETFDRNFGGKDYLRDSTCVLIGICCIPLIEIALSSSSFIVYEVDFRLVALLMPASTFVIHVVQLICLSSHISEAFYMTISLSHSILVVLLMLSFLIQFKNESRCVTILITSFCCGVGIVLHIANFHIGSLGLKKSSASSYISIKSSCPLSRSIFRRGGSTIRLKAVSETYSIFDVSTTG